MINSQIIIRTPLPRKDLRLSHFRHIEPPDIILDTDEYMTLILIRKPEKKGVAWESVFDVLEKRNVILEHCNVIRDYENRSDWKDRNFERDGVIAGALSWEDLVKLSNPPEQYELWYGHKGYLSRRHPAIVQRKPKGLIAEAAWDRLFSKEICEFLTANGAQFKTGPVIYKGQSLDDWFRVYPKHKVEVISPECLSEMYYRDEDFPAVDTYGIRIASGSLGRRPFALDKRGHDIAGREPYYLINLDLVRKMLETFKKGHWYMDPVFSAEGAIGKLFLEVMARAKPLIEKKPATNEEYLASRKSKPTRKAARKTARRFKVSKRPALATFKSKRYVYELREDKGVSGGKSETESHLDCLLLDTGRVPEAAREAPIASWLLSRLCAEAPDRTLLADEYGADGGGYALNFLVRERSRKSVAGFQLQGNTFRIAVLGDYREGVKPRDVIDDFVALLVREPEKLARCRVRIYDPEWKESPEEYEPAPKRSTRNKYGWDGRKFLGSDNIWNAGACTHERPDRYRDYMNDVHKAWKKRPSR